MSKILITGGCGFAGSHIVEELLNDPTNQIVVIDNFSYAARLDNLIDFDQSRLRVICYDFRSPFTDSFLKLIGNIDYIIHNGAESHVARSFKNPRIFVESNILGTLNLLEAARKLIPKKFIYVSTDEVFGPSHGKAFKETDTLRPTNPYAATKASGEYLAYSYFKSFGLPVVITRTMNMYGERQHYEKFVPKAISKVLKGESVEIQANGVEIGSRHWLHAREQAQALNKLLAVAVAGESYNISSGTVQSNLDIAELVANILEKPLYYLITNPNIPVHDLHYSIDDSKMRAIWPYKPNFEEEFTKTVLWYKDNPSYLEE